MKYTADLYSERWLKSALLTCRYPERWFMKCTVDLYSEIWFMKCTVDLYSREVVYDVYC